MMLDLLPREGDYVVLKRNLSEYNDWQPHLLNEVGWIVDDKIGPSKTGEYGYAIEFAIPDDSLVGGNSFVCFFVGKADFEVIHTVIFGGET